MDWRLVRGRLGVLLVSRVESIASRLNVELIQLGSISEFRDHAQLWKVMGSVVRRQC